MPFTLVPNLLVDLGRCPALACASVSPSPGTLASCTGRGHCLQPQPSPVATRDRVQPSATSPTLCALQFDVPWDCVSGNYRFPSTFNEGIAHFVLATILDEANLLTSPTKDEVLSIAWVVDKDFVESPSRSGVQQGGVVEALRDRVIDDSSLVRYEAVGPRSWYRSDERGAPAARKSEAESAIGESSTRARWVSRRSRHSVGSPNCARRATGAATVACGTASTRCRPRDLVEPTVRIEMPPGRQRPVDFGTFTPRRPVARAAGDAEPLGAPVVAVLLSAMDARSDRWAGECVRASAGCTANCCWITRERCCSPTTVRGR